MNTCHHLLNQTFCNCIGLKFWSAGMNKDDEQQLVNFIESWGGKYQQENVDYLVVPVHGVETDVEAKHVVNHAWLVRTLSKYL
jgi:hypothetical protein